MKRSRASAGNPRIARRPVLLAAGFVLTWLLLATGGVVTRPAWAAPAVIKFACVAPEGSLWVNLTREWDRELRSRSQNRARIQIFSGGILGEEIDAIRKMRAGQIQATGVTGIGMGEMVPATRVLELPRMFRDTGELDAALKRLDSYYVGAFKERGYVLLGFTEVGPIYLFTRSPIQKVADLNSRRMWVWEGDPVSQEISRVFKVSAVPLSLLNVLPSLQTGVVDGVYGSPLSTVTMQWNSYLKYMSSEPLAYAIGVIAMDRRAFDALPADVQALQLELGRKYTREMVLRSRVDNARAIELMKQKGMQVVTLDRDELGRLDAQARQVWTNLTGKLYTGDLLSQVQAGGTQERTQDAGARR